MRHAFKRLLNLTRTLAKRLKEISDLILSKSFYIFAITVVLLHDSTVQTTWEMPSKMFRLAIFLENFINGSAGGVCSRSPVISYGWDGCRKFFSLGASLPSWQYSDYSPTSTECCTQVRIEYQFDSKNKWSFFISCPKTTNLSTVNNDVIGISSNCFAISKSSNMLPKL